MSPERGRMEGLLVLKEETVATSLAGLVCDPSAFIVEEYSEEVGQLSVLSKHSDHSIINRLEISKMLTE